jgi:putative ABC transport system permease protein
LIPGVRELVVGKIAREQFSALDLGSTPRLNGQLWRVVGVFDAGNCHDSEIWGDTAVVGSAYRRGSDTNSITVRLKDTAAFAALKARLTSDPRLKVDVKTTRDYYRQQSQTLTRRVRILGVTVAVIMAIGATLGAINTIYAALATRTREIATLRAIGFEEVPLVMSILLETMLLALLGGTAGAAAAWALFDDFTAATLGENFGQVVFAFKLSPAVLWYGLQWALVIGFVGGLLPALRAARMPMS